MAEASVNAIRGFVRDMEVPMSDGRVLAGTSNPTMTGGYLVTFRDTGRDRIGEQRALELLSDAFESADMGMMLWDASLRIQRVTRPGGAWSPDRARGSVRTHGVAHILSAGIDPMPEGEGPESRIDR